LVCYRTSYINYWIAKKILTLKYISLVNLILDSEVVIELIQKECNLERLELELKKLINLKDENQQEGYEEVYSTLGLGGACEKTANLIYNAMIS